MGGICDEEREVFEMMLRSWASRFSGLVPANFGREAANNHRRSAPEGKKQEF